MRTCIVFFEGSAKNKKSLHGLVDCKSIEVPSPVICQGQAKYWVEITVSYCIWLLFPCWVNDVANLRKLSFLHDHPSVTGQIMALL